MFIDLSAICQNAASYEWPHMLQVLGMRASRITMSDIPVRIASKSTSNNASPMVVLNSALMQPTDNPCYASDVETPYTSVSKLGVQICQLR